MTTGLPGFLTNRDRWAGSFEELLTLDEPRTDAPLHLPTAPKPATPFPACERTGCPGPPSSPPPATAAMGIGDDEQSRRLLQYHGSSGSSSRPNVAERHCSANAAGGQQLRCTEPGGEMTQKQRNQLQQLAGALAGQPQGMPSDFSPDGQYTSAEATKLIAQMFSALDSGGSGV
jgi:hypothetical protein